jgi:ubiquinone/menaquinone biosynthesis C-methylase UbiE
MKLPRIVRKTARAVINSTPVLRRYLLTSTDYQVLNGVDEARAAAESSEGWLTMRTAARQHRAYENLIAAMKRGEPRLDLKVAAEAVAAADIRHPRLLEIGCGSGYYSEVFSALVPGSVDYTGIDYSKAMIERARARYPSAAFEVADARILPYPDGAFDIVFNGVSLMHIIDYQTAIRETARVTGRYCIFHCVPVFDHHPTTFLRKYAYGAPVVEIVFGKPELMKLCRDAGLRFEREWFSIPYDVSTVTGHRSIMETYLFSRGSLE